MKELEPVFNTQKTPAPVVFPLYFVNFPWNTQSIPREIFEDIEGDPPDHLKIFRL